MKKVLVITYYWPPSGGAGVQRWLKNSKYLAELGHEVHVLTLDENSASYPVEDLTLEKEIHPNITVHKTKSFEILQMYSKLFGKKNLPHGGFANVETKSLKSRLMRFIRGNFFLPDPRKGWNKFAIKKAKEVVHKFGITNIITTSPPHSTQLIGLTLKKTYKNKVNWIADFRDPWTDIFYYELLNTSKRAHKINLKYERSVLENSDHIITAANQFKELFLEKSVIIDSSKFSVINNGFDPADFGKAIKKDTNEFIITYTGTMSDHYEPQVFFRNVQKVTEQFPRQKIKVQIVGTISENLQKDIVKEIGDKVEFISYVPHEKAVEYMVTSNLLLLITGGNEASIPGKVFEYLAADCPIICIGKGDASSIVENCKAGKGFDRSEGEEILFFLNETVHNHISNSTLTSNKNEINNFSRKEQSKIIANLLK